MRIISTNEEFDAWELKCAKDDRNIVAVVEDGLKNGRLQIPGATAETDAVFQEITGVSSYLKHFGVHLADRIQKRYSPLYDPAKEPLSEYILRLNDFIQQKAGYSLYEAQLAVAEAAKRKIDRHSPAMIIAECGAGKSVTRSIVKSYGTKTISFWRTGNPIGGMMG